MTAKNEIKRNAKKEIENFLKSPFAVLKVINNNKDNEAIAAFLKFYNIEKLTLNMLLTVENGGLPLFCKLQKVSDIDFLDGNELKVVKIRNTYYEYVPVKFSVSAFFQSFEGALKIAKEEQRITEEKKKKTEKKATLSAEKKAANRAAKVAAKAKELKEKYADLPDNIIMQLAEEFFKAA